MELLLRMGTFVGEQRFFRLPGAVEIRQISPADEEKLRRVLLLRVGETAPSRKSIRIQKTAMRNVLRVDLLEDRQPVYDLVHKTVDDGTHTNSR